MTAQIMAGRLQLSRFTSLATGEARESWQCVADSVISACTVRDDLLKRVLVMASRRI